MGKIRLGNNTTNSGYVISGNQWNQGFATEILITLIKEVANINFEKPIESYCDVENKASARVMEKAGMSFAKTLDNYLILPNISVKPRDCLLYRYMN